MKRHTLQITQETFNQFEELKNQLDMNTDDTLKTLLQKEIIKNETIIVSNKIKNRIE